MLNQGCREGAEEGTLIVCDDILKVVSNESGFEIGQVEAAVVVGSIAVCKIQNDTI